MFIEGFGGHEIKKNKSADAMWRGFDAICVCHLIDHGQQPMKMHIEVTLYKLTNRHPFSCVWGPYNLLTQNYIYNLYKYNYINYIYININIEL